MRWLSLTAGAICLALVTGTAALAQVPPPEPGNPNEAVPDVMPNDIPYGESINLETAKKVADAAEAEAKKRNWKMCIAVVGPTGELVYFEKMDGCQYASVQISQHKARTAARYRRPTLVFERLRAKGFNFAYLPTLDDIIASRGGNLLMADGKIIGAIGVSGGAGSQDDTISQAGVAGLK